MPVYHHPSREEIDAATLLRALGDDTRLNVIRQLADGQPHACGSIKTGLSPASMTRHFRTLREAGLIRTEPSGTSKLLTLRREDVEARFPGLLASLGIAPSAAHRERKPHSK